MVVFVCQRWTGENAFMELDGPYHCLSQDVKLLHMQKAQK